MIDKDRKAQEYAAQISRLERIEMDLIDRLKETSQRQKSAYLNLEKVVYDGYEYYLQSFVEKKGLADSKNPRA